MVYLGLGSNLGERQKNLAAARKALAKLGKIKKKSAVIETKAWGKTDQPDFLNQVLALETDLPPFELLSACQKIETALGRVREERWGPRTLDIDLLLYGELIVDLPELKIPHPYLAQRAFVLTPLAQIAPHLRHPVSGKTMAELLQELSQDNVIPIQIKEFADKIGRK